MRKVACGLQPSTTTARAGQANTGGIRGKVRSICGAKVGATYGNDGEHTKGGVDYDRRNLIRGGSVVGYRSAGEGIRTLDIQLGKQKASLIFIEKYNGFQSMYSRKVSKFLRSGGG